MGIEQQPDRRHINAMDLSRIATTIATTLAAAALMGILSLAWDGSKELAFMRADLAVIKTTTLAQEKFQQAEVERVKDEQKAITAILTEFRVRLRKLEGAE